MTTVWDLYFEWKQAQAEAARTRERAAAAAQHALTLDLQLKTALQRSGSVLVGRTVVRLCGEVIHCIEEEEVHDAINVALDGTIQKGVGE